MTQEKIVIDAIAQIDSLDPTFSHDMRSDTWETILYHCFGYCEKRGWIFEISNNTIEHSSAARIRIISTNTPWSSVMVSASGERLEIALLKTILKALEQCHV